MYSNRGSNTSLHLQSVKNHWTLLTEYGNKYIITMIMNDKYDYYNEWSGYKSTILHLKQPVYDIKLYLIYLFIYLLILQKDLVL